VIFGFVKMIVSLVSFMDDMKVSFFFAIFAHATLPKTAQGEIIDAFGN